MLFGRAIRPVLCSLELVLFFRKRLDQQDTATVCFRGCACSEYSESCCNVILAAFARCRPESKVPTLRNTSYVHDVHERLTVLALFHCLCSGFWSLDLSPSPKPLEATSKPAALVLLIARFCLTSDRCAAKAGSSMAKAAEVRASGRARKAKSSKLSDFVTEEEDEVSPCRGSPTFSHGIRREGPASTLTSRSLSSSTAVTVPWSVQSCMSLAGACWPRQGLRRVT